MVQLIDGLTAERVRANLDARARTGSRRRAAIPTTVEILAAVKYLPPDALPALAQGGIRTVGENRAQELERKRSAPGADAFTWDFIGQLQSRKVRDILPHVRYIHSVASDSVLGQLSATATVTREC